MRVFFSLTEKTSEHVISDSQRLLWTLSKQSTAIDLIGGKGKKSMKAIAHEKKSCSVHLNDLFKDSPIQYLYV